MKGGSVEAARLPSIFMGSDMGSRRVFVGVRGPVPHRPNQARKFTALRVIILAPTDESWAGTQRHATSSSVLSGSTRQPVFGRGPQRPDRGFMRAGCIDTTATRPARLEAGGCWPIARTNSTDSLAHGREGFQAEGVRTRQHPTVDCVDSQN